MPDTFEKLQSDLEEFIEQREKLMLVISCKSAETMYILKILSVIETSGSPDLFLLFSDDFVMPGPYASVMIERLKIQHQEGCKALEKEGKEQWAPLPVAVSDESRSPVERMKEAMLFVRSKLIPPKGGHRLMWGIFPMNIKGRDEYLKMITQLLPRDGIEPWMRGLRIIVRDDADSPLITPYRKNSERVQIYNPDLSPDAIMDDVEEKVKDPDTSDEEWAQSLLLLACTDYAKQQYKNAIQKYQQLLRYYQDTNNIMMQAFVINSMGDVFYRMDNLEEAQKWYECAIIPASDAKMPNLLLTIARNLGHVAYKLKQYDQAEEYFDGANKLAGELRDAEAKTEALEWIGLSQEQQRKFDRAVENWQAAVELSRSLEMEAPLKRNLEHLDDIYKSQHLKDQRHQVEAELDEIEQKEKKHGKK
jgi:tetratricopeptide (TPR) repeat protein